MQTSELTLAEKIGQLFLVGFEGLTPPGYLLDWLSEGRVGGVILFSRNVESPEQLAALTQACHEAAHHPLLIAIDQEGGMVARLYGDFTESPGAMALGAARDGEAITEEMSYVLATEMRSLGINWNYAPVLDIAYHPDNPTIATRSPGADARHVGRIAAAAVRGFQRGGVAACGKHFPGLGDTPIDTHEALAKLDVSVDHLKRYDLTPYRAAIAAGLASVMTTHTVFTALDADLPATLSPIVVNELLRGELGFDGVVATDCMEMKAIADHHSPGESAILAALAGIDLVLVSHTQAMQAAAYDGLLAAVERGDVAESLVDTAVTRILRLKERFAITETPSAEDVRRPEHLATARRAARAGIVLVRDGGDLPLRPEESGRIGVVEFASYMESDVLDRGDVTGFVKALRRHLPDIPAAALKSTSADAKAAQRARGIAAEVDVLVLAVRSAHLNPEQLHMARELIATAQRVVLVCLRNPYDAGILDRPSTALCTFSDSQPSLTAAADALVGSFRPDGVMPVPLAGHSPTEHYGRM